MGSLSERERQIAETQVRIEVSDEVVVEVEPDVVPQAEAPELSGSASLGRVPLQEELLGNEVNDGSGLLTRLLSSF